MKKLILMVVLLFLFSSCQAQEYPSRSIQIIVPYSPGGTTDLVARAFAQALSEELKQEVSVVNQAGASGSVGTLSAFQAKQDGYTLLFSADSLGIQRVMNLTELSFDDFEPVMLVSNDPKVIVVNAKGPYDNVEDLFAAMQDKGLSMSYTGPGGSGHIQALLYEKLGAKLTLTPFPGGLDAIVALMGDQVDFTNSNASVVWEYIQSGHLKALAVCGNNPLSLDPSIPLLGDEIQGAGELMDLAFTPLSLLVGNQTPPEIVEKLRDAAKKATKNPQWMEYMEKSGQEILYTRYEKPEEIKGFFKEFESKMSWLLYDAGVSFYSPEDFGIERP
ncbi:MAG: tripartite tricarboxylate transporter substrate binding protein [Tissierellia bacterium]|nr:tripartite tricarboxylate transporter substrate binding protein [Tissierellia bacterium]